MRIQVQVMLMFLGKCLQGYKFSKLYPLRQIVCRRFIQNPETRSPPKKLAPGMWLIGSTKWDLSSHGSKKPPPPPPPPAPPPAPPPPPPPPPAAAATTTTTTVMVWQWPRLDEEQWQLGVGKVDREKEPNPAFERKHDWWNLQEICQMSWKHSIFHVPGWRHGNLRVLPQCHAPKK